MCVSFSESTLTFDANEQGSHAGSHPLFSLQVSPLGAREGGREVEREGGREKEREGERASERPVCFSSYSILLFVCVCL